MVLRDWAHLDYIGYPFVTTPDYRPQLYFELADDFDIIRISTTRDPVTQWQSLTQLKVMQGSPQTGAFGIDQFLAGYRKYAELCIETGFIRYEDFLRKPDLSMQKLCKHLQIKYDPSFNKKIGRTPNNHRGYFQPTQHKQNQNASQAPDRTEPEKKIPGEC